MDIPILKTHAFNASTNTNLNDARLDGISDINNGLQTTGALTVQAPHCGRLGESGNESSSTEFRRTTTRRQDGADSNIFDEFGVNTAPADKTLECTH
jgi:hypothetical protein